MDQPPSLRGQPESNTLRSWLDYHGGVEAVLESAGPKCVALRWDSEMFEDPEICKCVAGCWMLDEWCQDDPETGGWELFENAIGLFGRP